jgi:hypothetical protein
MVRVACRRLPRGAEDSEDAYQPTFPVLIRRTGATAPPELVVGHWPIGVARPAGTARVLEGRAARVKLTFRVFESDPGPERGPSGQALFSLF